MVEHMLGSFGIDSSAFLGRGSESAVYALDEARVLRLYHGLMPRDYMQRRAQFYAWLREQHPAFETPAIEQFGQRADRTYTIERRMRGSDFASALPALRGAGRERALRSYLDVAQAIGAIDASDRPFGEMLTLGAPVQHASWGAFIHERVSKGYQDGRHFLEADVPGVERAFGYILEQCQALDAYAARRLVHGDYFPGNVFVDQRQIIFGVGDFGYSTVAGDPRLDVAGALAFLEVVDGYQPADSAMLHDEITRRYGAEIEPWLELYRLYYSFYFSSCKDNDPRTYWWCAGNLQRWLDSH